MAKKTYSFKYGGKRGKKVNLVESPDMVVVRTKGNQELKDTDVSRNARELIQATDMVLELPDAGISILRTQGDTIQEAKVNRDLTRAALKEEGDIRFAGRVLQDSATGEAMLYTENFFVKFKDQTAEKICLDTLAQFHLQVKDVLIFAKNAYFVCAAEGTGLAVFDIADALMKHPEVEYCHPELVQERRFKDVVHPLQWHLTEANIKGKTVAAHVGIQEAWKLTKGAGITIAVIDDGFDLNHPEFKGRIVAPYDAAARSSDPSPVAPDENHGTACAGVACAAGLDGGASGTAPEAKLMPIRLRAALGSMAEAQAFAYAAQKGADVISCSWGPTDARWWDPMDPIRNRQSLLPDSTRLALEYALKNGRGGKGCVILFAAGNGNESTENDGYVSYPDVIAVAACNDTGKRSVYSDYGSGVFVAFPSGDFAWRPYNHPAPISEGIRTTDRLGEVGYSTSDYTNSFTGTSSACPGMAGVVALMLAINPNLTYREVKDIIRQSCVQIDPQNGAYSSIGHSEYYGHGRINAALAVANAKKFHQGAPTTATVKPSPAPATNGVSAGTTTPASTPAKSTVGINGSARFSDGKTQSFSMGTWVEKSGKRLLGLTIGISGAAQGTRIRAEINLNTSGTSVASGTGVFVGITDGRKSVHGLSLTLDGPLSKVLDIVYGVRFRGSATVYSGKNGSWAGRPVAGGSTGIEAFTVMLKLKS